MLKRWLLLMLLLSSCDDRKGVAVGILVSAQSFPFCNTLVLTLQGGESGRTILSFKGWGHTVHDYDAFIDKKVHVDWSIPSTLWLCEQGSVTILRQGE